MKIVQPNAHAFFHIHQVKQNSGERNVRQMMIWGLQHSLQRRFLES